MAKKESHSRFRLLKWLWLLLLLLILLPVLFFGIVGMGWFGKLPDTTVLENPKTPVASEVISSDGKVLGKYYDENRTMVNYEDLSPQLINALIATEDVRFYEHSGIDFWRSFTVLIHTMLGDKQGGSTISQQTAKNLFHDRPRHIWKRIVQKMQEWVIAIRLERLYTKEEIIAMYFNTVDFGNNAVGIKSAANTYFGKSPDKLDAKEAAVLVGLLKAPTYYNPVRNPNNSLRRRNTVLAQMEKYGYLKPAEFEKLKVEPTVLSFQVESHNTGSAMYFREYIRQFLNDWAKENNVDIYRDGLRIYTTIDSRIQNYAEDALYNHMKERQAAFYAQFKASRTTPWTNVPEIIELTKKRSERYRALKADNVPDEVINKVFNKPLKMRVFSYRGPKDTVMSPLDSIKYYKYFLHSGFMAMEPNTGQVKAWVGGVDFRYFKYDHVDPKAKRQVGSTFKPIVYAAAIDNGFSPCQKEQNEPVVFEEYQNWTPKNSDGKYGGEMSLIRGLAGSVNCITARVMKQVGINPVVQMAQNMGIKSQLDPVPSLCLGTADISVFEMTAAFNTFNNKGTYIEPLLITRIEDKNGKVLQQFIPNSRMVLSDKKAYIMVNMLKGVTNCSLYGTACRLRYRYNLRGPMGGKTGTTQNNSDGWFMGIIPQLTGGIWVGAEDRSIHFTNMNEGQGAAVALPIWAFFLQKVYADKSLGFDPNKDWEVPPGDFDIEFDCDKYQQQQQDQNPEKQIFSAGGMF